MTKAYLLQIKGNEIPPRGQIARFHGSGDLVLIMLFPPSDDLLK